MKSAKILLFVLLNFHCFAQITSKRIAPSVLQKLVTDDAIVEQALQFEDKNGTNYLVAVILQNRSDEWESKTLLVKHYIKKANNPFFLLRQINETEVRCELDNELKFVDKSFIISDLDKNNYAEISFVYKTGCRGDVSPIVMKVIVLENGNKAAIRGKTQPRSFDFKKEKVPDAAFNKLPKLIQNQANILWDKYVLEF